MRRAYSASDLEKEKAWEGIVNGFCELGCDLIARNV
eukprot:CAMPEP_0194127842 /NCGR_PEP_ID=MMETSP0150-20130528/60735_1 /TAXON_ID=122233 /ORGANISM="Chaetoceros debilis, Strain MM31A-1" /LENGTH=35 /DNA_ID= /DNA_START= /DNA_END= /DNA_ORIENTATION=